MKPIFAMSALRGLSIAALSGPFARKVMGLSAFTAAGQLAFVLALPLLSRLYSPSDFGVFTIYLSIVNMGGPIAGLKFDSALYAARSRRDAVTTLVLALTTLIATTALVSAALYAFADRIVAVAGAGAGRSLWIIPVGLMLSGCWSISSAWAIRLEATTVLGAARFGQPALMTALQLAMGFWAPGGLVLIIAHLISHAAYSTLIFSATVKGEDLAAARELRGAALVAQAVRLRSFPLFVLSAQISTLSVGNLPPLLLSLLYGAEIAGHFGIAYRIVAAPLTIASMPLGAIFTGLVSRAPSLERTGPLARKVFLANLALVAIPVLLVGVAAPTFAPIVLGQRWALTGQIIAALAVLGAAQTLATPFAEMTSIFNLQRLRFVIEIGTGAAVIAAIFLGAQRGFTWLQTIWLMSVAGAIFSVLGLAAVLTMLRATSPDERATAAAAPRSGRREASDATCGAPTRR